MILVFADFGLAHGFMIPILSMELSPCWCPKQKNIEFFVPFKFINCFLVNVDYRSMWVNVHKIVDWHILQPYKFRWTSAVRLKVHIPKINTIYPNNSKCNWPSFVVDSNVDTYPLGVDIFPMLTKHVANDSLKIESIPYLNLSSLGTINNRNQNLDLLHNMFGRSWRSWATNWITPTYLPYLKLGTLYHNISMFNVESALMQTFRINIYPILTQHWFNS